VSNVSILFGENRELSDLTQNIIKKIMSRLQQELNSNVDAKFLNELLHLNQSLLSAIGGK
jgi:hypothetical protein